MAAGQREVPSDPRPVGLIKRSGNTNASQAYEYARIDSSEKVGTFRRTISLQRMQSFLL
jgi:hypothetical protein